MACSYNLRCTCGGILAVKRTFAALGYIRRERECLNPKCRLMWTTEERAVSSRLPSYRTSESCLKRAMENPRTRAVEDIQ